MRIWERAFIESHLTSPHGPSRIAACSTAYKYGFEVDEIVELSGLPKWRVQQAILISRRQERRRRIMPAIWFVGDSHFGHAKVSEIRGFESIEAHDASIVARWRKQVQDDDTVYVLGDISSGSTTGELHALGILADLPGRKRLIAGNHDSVSGIHRGISRHARNFGQVFDSVNDVGRVRIEGRDVLLSHYPYVSQGDGPGRGAARYAQWRLPDLGNLLIHAHTHHTNPFDGSPTGREMCVSWDAWRRLVNLGDVARWVKENERAA